MAYRKTKDLCCAVGEYQNAAGENKKRWQNVGVQLTDDEGKSFILINRTFNPAGAPATGRGDPSMVALAMFDPQDNRYGAQQPHPTPEQQQQRSAQQPLPVRPPNGGTLADDDVPF